MSDDLSFLDVEEKYIPVRVSVLLDRILQDDRLSQVERNEFETFAQMIGQRFHFDFYHESEKLQNCFVPFDPDCDTLCNPEPTPQLRQDRGVDLINGLVRLAVACNFVRLKEEELNHCLKYQPNGGISVRVDLSEFDSFHVYFRGRLIEEVPFPKWQLWRRNTTRYRRILKRTLVLARCRSEFGGNVIVKLFKDVPVENIKIIAPKVSFSMPIFDRLKVGGSFLGGLAATVLKVMKLAVFTGQFFLLLAVSLIVVIVKGILSFFNSRTKYLHRYSSSLYYQCLSNNSSAIAALVLMAEEQEIKETLLAAYMLHMWQGPPPTEHELDQRIEQWLSDNFGIELDFEVDDALRKLRDKRLLLELTDENEPNTVRLKFVPLRDALIRLDEDWDNFYQFNE